MTIQEYLNENLPFYHITLSVDKDANLKEGLRAGNCAAICVVRRNNCDIWRDIIHNQLCFDNQEFAVIKLLPRKHGILLEEVAPDSVDEPTKPLHNYIVKQSDNVDETDFVETNFDRGVAPDLTKIGNLIVPLEDYLHTEIPSIEVVGE